MFRGLHDLSGSLVGLLVLLSLLAVRGLLNWLGLLDLLGLLVLHGVLYSLACLLVGLFCLAC